MHQDRKGKEDPKPAKATQQQSTQKTPTGGATGVHCGLTGAGVQHHHNSP